MSYLDIRGFIASGLFLGASALARVLEAIPNEPHWLVVLLNYLGPLYLAVALLGTLKNALGKKWPYSLAWGIGALLWFPQATALVSVDLGGSAEDRDRFRLLSFNVRVFRAYRHLNTDYRETRELIDFLQNFEADIKCLQEYWSSTEGGADSPMNVTGRLVDDGYGAAIAPFVGNPAGREFGLAVFSKWPVLATGMVAMPVQHRGNGALWVDIELGNRVVRLFNAHLGSSGLSDSWGDLNASVFSWATVERLKAYIKTKVAQAANLSLSIAQSPHPAILCGDLNDPPIGFAYRRLTGELNDAIRWHAWGLAGTVNKSLGGGLRIDHVFADPSFVMERAAVVTGMQLSDHFPIVVDFSIR